MKKLVFKIMFIVFAVSLISCTDNTEKLVTDNQLETELINSNIENTGFLTDPDDDGTSNEDEEETGN
ncbi:hypothetical protein [uncultured Tenacibaculum sp.]|uniref:hypothetical protein n=1 Tax=uncultured Tenacibaculum sp. TaxID=174713 RepID=UPI002601A803|nr:hypothetical protein [uncultured Tenacibaculum sp.]